MEATELVDKQLVKAWARWSLVWLTLFPFVGILVSIQFHIPEFFDGMPWFTFGRLRAVHLGGVLFGSFTSAFITLLYYFVPRLTGTPLYKVEWGWWLLWIWNAFLLLGSLSLCMGYMVGVEYAEYEWPLNSCGSSSSRPLLFKSSARYYVAVGLASTCLCGTRSPQAFGLSLIFHWALCSCPMAQ
ncbi:MAG: hypothetical protein HC801_09530 [Nitrospira sp.]|nr:hypothetical protein [Nitrospira sp.]